MRACIRAVSSAQCNQSGDYLDDVRAGTAAAPAAAGRAGALQAAAAGRQAAEDPAAARAAAEAGGRKWRPSLRRITLQMQLPRVTS